MTDTIDTPLLEELLERRSRGGRSALDELMTALYQEIHGVAASQLRHERHLILQPTALVNEVYLRLSSAVNMSVRDRSYFYR